MSHSTVGPFRYLSRSLLHVLCVASLAWPLHTPAQTLQQKGSGLRAPVTSSSTRTSDTSAAKAAIKLPLLPPDFAGEPREGSISIHPAANDVDAAHAAVLTEDGFVEADTALYAGAGTASWSVQVLRFGDATGALSAFTFFRDPSMQAAAVGDNGAANAGLYLVRTRASVVMVRPAAGTSGDARSLVPFVTSLVQSLPAVHGPEAVAPALPGLLPVAGLQSQTMHYAIGPASYNGPLPVGAMDFGRDAEVATARYHLPSGADAALTLWMLPTPQIAGAGLRTVLALPDASLHRATRRIGPLVGVVSGASVTPAEAEQLLAGIHYVSDITINQPQGYISEVAKTAKLLLGIAYFTALLGLAALTIAVFLGFGRLFYRRLRGKPDSSLNDDTFIRLKI
ncbi:DUF6599 family protein [Acidipila sp. EB88]|uniref:DUF6599 family protein n=1 Tax=Acidipila sp. EB88 TaxID=2305226 RepID=UPI000F5E304E|nr:DUF6599 family protein [Acidipila sp. EB88]RRA47894.1 hypothetical protein D1Y84_05890 [Acidipila sp. EB88]